MKAIETIVHIDKEGNMWPYRFRLTAEDESLVVVNISRVLFCEEETKGRLKYRCECVIQDRKRCVDIYFKKMDMRWYLKV